jgi:hypothetical protein
MRAREHHEPVPGVPECSARSPLWGAGRQQPDRFGHILQAVHVPTPNPIASSGSLPFAGGPGPVGLPLTCQLAPARADPGPVTGDDARQVGQRGTRQRQCGTVESMETRGQPPGQTKDRGDRFIYQGLRRLPRSPRCTPSGRKQDNAEIRMKNAHGSIWLQSD